MPIMDVTKLFLTTPEIKDIIYRTFRLLSTKILMRFRKHSSEYHVLSRHSSEYHVLSWPGLSAGVTARVFNLTEITKLPGGSDWIG